MRNIQILILVVSSILWVSGTMFADIISVPGDYTEIQAAIDAADENDTVEVSYSEYAENITMKDGVNLVGIEDKVSGKPVIKGNGTDGRHVIISISRAGLDTVGWGLDLRSDARRRHPRGPSRTVASDRLSRYRDPRGRRISNHELGGFERRHRRC